MSIRKKELEELLEIVKKQIRTHKVDWSKKDRGASMVEHQKMLDDATKLRVELDELLINEKTNESK